MTRSQSWYRFIRIQSHIDLYKPGILRFFREGKKYQEIVTIISQQMGYKRWKKPAAQIVDRVLYELL